MPTATKTRPQTIDAMRSAAIASWRRWARDLADGRGLPPAGELAEVAAVLGRPLESLERDAKILQEHDAAVMTRDQWRAAADRVEAERGDREELRAEIERLQTQIEELQKRETAGHFEALQLGQAMRAVRHLRKQRPDLFGDVEDEA